MHRHSGGNALFMAALVQDMVKKGLIAQAQRNMDAHRAAWRTSTPGVPDTLQQMLDIQIEQLSAEEQRVLEGASVAGERFSVWAVAAMLDTSADSIEAAYERLVGRQQFIRFVGIHAAANGADSAHYEFRHALYRQALYRQSFERESDPNFTAPGRAAHADLFRRKAGAGFGSCAALRRRAGLRASRALFDAGCREHAEAVFLSRFHPGSSAGARTDLRTGLSQGLTQGLTTGIELEIQIYQRIGDAQFALGEMSASVESYETAADLAAKADLRAEQVAILMQMALPVWFIDQARGDQVRGEQVLKQALQVSRSLSDPLLLAQTELAAACFRLLYDSWRAEDLETCVRAEKTIRSLAGPSCAPACLPYLRSSA